MRFHPLTSIVYLAHHRGSIYPLLACNCVQRAPPSGLRYSPPLRGARCPQGARGLRPLPTVGAAPALPPASTAPAVVALSPTRWTLAAARAVSAKPPRPRAPDHAARNKITSAVGHTFSHNRESIKEVGVFHSIRAVAVTAMRPPCALVVCVFHSIRAGAMPAMCFGCLCFS